MKNDQVLVVLSGGMDSTVLATYYKALGNIVHAVSFDYGQRHRKELDFARTTASLIAQSHEVVDMSFMSKIFPESSQTAPSIPVPHGHYTEATMKATVVPNRNMVMLSVAAALALRRDCSRLAYGAHAGDHAIYPDCRPAFVAAMRDALALADWKKLQLDVPFLSLDKAQICALGHRLGVPWENTWSCYEGGADHCGKCGTCVERQEAFSVAGLFDPTRYAEHPMPF